MAKKVDKQRKQKFEEVMAAVLSRGEFVREQIVAECREAKAMFVTNVLKQLTSDAVIGLLRIGEASDDVRYTWIVQREHFDSAKWIDSQLFGGTQVTAAPVEERPRERLLEVGAQGLRTSELLAILIRSGVRGESAVQGGQKLASYFEDQLERLPQHSQRELKALSRSVSTVPFCQIMAGVELGRRVAEAAGKRLPREKINSTQAAVEYCARHFSRLANDAVQEEFHIVTLDTKLQPIQSHRVTVGTLDASLVHPREVFRPAIRDAASAILLVHNHPSGDPTPSRQDRDVTERLKKSGELIGIQVIDHVIVAKTRSVSLAEHD